MISGLRSITGQSANDAAKRVLSIALCVSLAVAVIALPARSDDAKSAVNNSAQPTPPKAAQPPSGSQAGSDGPKIETPGRMPGPTVKLKPGEAPKPVFDSLEHDFKSVMAGTDIHVDFTFRNEGNGTLEILLVKPSCGCTTSGEFEKIIEPGGKGKIPLLISTTNLSGETTKPVTVFTNASGDAGRITLTIKGDVRPVVVIEPAKVEFGSFKAADVMGKTLSRKLKVTSQIDTPLELGEIRSSNPNFSAAVRPIEPGKTYEVLVTLGPNTRTGSNGAHIEIDTNYPAAPALRIPAAVFVDSPVDVMPSQLVLPPNRRQTLTRAFFIRNNTVHGMQVGNLRVSNPQVKATLHDTTPGFSWRISVEIPTDYAGSLSGDTISVSTTHQEVPELIVDILAPLPPRMPATEPAKGDAAASSASREADMETRIDAAEQAGLKE